MDADYTMDPQQNTAADVVRQRINGVLDVPLHRALNMELVRHGDGQARIRIPVRGMALNNVGVAHGGILYVLLDAACYLSVLDSLAPDRNAVTHDIQVSIMRPVPAGATLEIEGRVLRMGSRLAFLRGEATSAGKLVAAASVSKSVVDL